MYWEVSNASYATKIVYQGAGGSSNRTDWHYVYFSSDHTYGGDYPNYRTRTKLFLL